jgi:hypothetical protein
MQVFSYCQVFLTNRVLNYINNYTTFFKKSSLGFYINGLI